MTIALKNSQLHPPVRGVHMAWAAASVAAMFAGAAIVGIAFGLSCDGDSSWIALGVSLGGAISGLGILWYGFYRRLGWSRRDFGFLPCTHSLRHLLWWIPLTLLGGGAATGVIGWQFGTEQKSSSIADGIDISPVAAVLAAVCGAVVIPLIEEVVFRRVLFDWLQGRMPTAIAASLTVAIFAVMHGIPMVVVYLIFAGTSIIVARLWFRSLTAPFLIHCVNNAVVFLVALNG